jgi:hypothetical protein
MKRPKSPKNYQPIMRLRLIEGAETILGYEWIDVIAIHSHGVSTLPVPVDYPFRMTTTMWVCVTENGLTTIAGDDVEPEVYGVGESDGDVYERDPAYELVPEVGPS